MMQIAIAHILRTIVISILAYPCINLMVSVIKKIIPGEEERIEVDLEGLDPKLAASLPAGALGVSKQVTVKWESLLPIVSVRVRSISIRKAVNTGVCPVSTRMLSILWIPRLPNT